MRLCSAHHVLCTFLFNLSVFKLAINYSIFFVRLWAFLPFYLESRVGILSFM